MPWWKQKPKPNFRKVKTDSAIEEAINRSKYGLAVQFVSSQCKSCELGTQELLRISQIKEYRKARFILADIDDVKATAAKYQVKAGPKGTIMIFQLGHLLERFDESYGTKHVRVPAGRLFSTEG